MKISVCQNQATGRIKPMHAINNAPTLPFDFYGLYDRYTEARIPYARLHDTGGSFGGAHYVDIENIFPNPDADVDDPSSYDFAFTDALVKGLIEHGVMPYYRLGATIENYQFIKPYHIYPPRDPAKWAEICEHIIMHYNEGWADGFNYGIEYWEIWNEPDNEPEIEKNPMWKGTVKEYFELYDTTARYLKARFPNIKVGGYGSCGFYAITSTDSSGVAHSSARTDYFIDFMNDFFALAAERHTPMDFFSWHSYADLKNTLVHAEYARKKLCEFGYGDIEIHFNEWNPGPMNRGEAIDAALIASQMIAMQHTSTDMCMYYDGSMNSSYCGIFDPVHQTTFKAYNAFLYFGELYALGNEIRLDIADAPDGVYACAACDNERGVLLVSNITGNEVAVDIDLNCATVSATDGEHDNAEFALNAGRVTLPVNAVWLIRFNR